MILFVVGCVFVPLGAACYAADRNVVEIVARYDDACAVGFFATDAEIANGAQIDGRGTTCEVTLTAPRSMRAPVFVYYDCLLYTSPSPRDQRGSRMPSSA